LRHTLPEEDQGKIVCNQDQIDSKVRRTALFC